MYGKGKFVVVGKGGQRRLPKEALADVRYGCGVYSVYFSLLQFSQYTSSTLSLTFKFGEVVVKNYVS